MLELERLWINGGRRGFLAALAPAKLMRITNATPVDVALER